MAKRVQLAQIVTYQRDDFAPSSLRLTVEEVADEILSRVGVISPVGKVIEEWWGGYAAARAASMRKKKKSFMLLMTTRS